MVSAWKRGVEDAAALSGFLLGSEQLNSSTFLDSQKVSICVLLLIKLSHLILQNHEFHL